MGDVDLTCNFKKCRKRLTQFAWVTSCSHVFCDEDGHREFNKALQCPACDTNLPGKYDILRHDLRVCEEWKSMVLAGYRPEIIMEICSRALAFWTYQVEEQKSYLQFMATSSRERVSQMEAYYEQVLSKAQTEINSLKIQIANSKKELGEIKAKYLESSDKLTEKSRQYQKLQGMYDQMRRKFIKPSAMVDHGETPSRPTPYQRDFSLNVQTGEDILAQTIPAADGDHHPPNNRSRKIHSPPEKDFVLQPTSTTSSAQDVQSRFMLDFGTPSLQSRKTKRKPPMQR